MIIAESSKDVNPGWLIDLPSNIFNKILFKIDFLNMESHDIDERKKS